MPTINTPITAAWTKVVDITDSDFLITWNTPVAVEVASTSADVAPVVQGHMLPNDSAITRNVLGAGYVWVKTIPGQYPSAIQLVVSK